MANNIKSSETVVVRTPLLPYTEIWTSLESEDALKQIYRNPVLQEALYLASPDLFDQALTWIKDEANIKQVDRRTIISLAKYFLRMSYRCTPFGIFAGISSLVASNSTLENNIRLSPRSTYKRNLRLDSSFSEAFILSVLQENQILENLKYYPNSSLYVIGTELRYVKYTYVNQARSYKIVSIRYTEHLAAILELVDKGGLYRDLVEGISTSEDDRIDSCNYINSLISEQIIVSELELSITGLETNEQAIQRLKFVEGAENYHEKLDAIAESIGRINNRLLGCEVECYKKIESEIMNNGIATRRNRIFQTDMQKPIESYDISVKLSQDILDALQIVSKLNRAGYSKNLNDFVEQFVNRYEEREIPLIEALDPEVGIGFPIGKREEGHDLLLKGLAFHTLDRTEVIRWQESDTVLFDLLQDAARQNRFKVDLDIKKFDALPKIHFPDSFSAMASVVYEDNAEYILLQGAEGLRATALLGRFCHVDTQIESLCKEIVFHEEALHPKSIRAEIVHMPESRTGNILQRPVLGEYEIPYLAKSSVEANRQIKVSDLAISVYEGQIKLRSVRLDKEVIPALSSAHNYSYNSLPVYHFLCSLGNTEYSLGFQWGALRQKCIFLPRITYKNIILSPATWNLTRERFKAIVDANNATDLKLNVQLLCSEYKIPRFTCIADGDNELLLDMTNDLCLEIFQRELQKKDFIILVESFTNCKKALVESEEGKFNNQLVFSFYKTEKPINSTVISTGKINGLKRIFPPGSEWLYYKIYGGISSQEQLLQKAIVPYVKQLLDEKIIESWFFIRYQDPEFHTRIRMKLSKEKDFSKVMSKIQYLCNPFVLKGQVSKIQIDTYYREIERYGSRTITEAEQLFFFDSEFYFGVSPHLKGYDNVWKIAVYNVYHWITCFNLSYGETVDLITSHCDSLREEYQINKNKKNQKLFSERYRLLKPGLGNVVNGTDPVIVKVMTMFQKRSEECRPIINSILTNIPDKIKLKDFIGSIIHMSLNRIFISKQRQQELVVYDILNRYFLSQIAINEGK